MKIRSIAQYSHKLGHKIGKNGCTKKDVIPTKPLKLVDGRAPIKNSRSDARKSALFGHHPPKTAHFSKIPLVSLAY